MYIGNFDFLFDKKTTVFRPKTDIKSITIKQEDNFIVLLYNIKGFLGTTQQKKAGNFIFITANIIQMTMGLTDN